MANNSRKKAMKHYAELYHLADVPRLVCAYCNDVRAELDHVPPISRIEHYGLQNLRKNGSTIELLLYPVCRWCNRQLGSKDLFTYEERLLYLYQVLQLKLEKSTFWSVDEIEELGGELKRMVTARQKQLRKEYLARLRAVEDKIRMLV